MTSDIDFIQHLNALVVYASFYFKFFGMKSRDIKSRGTNFRQVQVSAVRRVGGIKCPGSNVAVLTVAVSNVSKPYLDTS